MTLYSCSHELAPIELIIITIAMPYLLEFQLAVMLHLFCNFYGFRQNTCSDFYLIKCSKKAFYTKVIVKVNTEIMDKVTFLQILMTAYLRVFSCFRKTYI